MTTKPPRTREAVASTTDEAPAQRASEAGTARYRDRFAPRFAPDFFRAAPFDTTVSSLGIGTYLGEPTATDDAAYADSVEHAVRSGVNLIDTALNYRGQRSERAVGAALRRLTASGTGDVSRDEVVLCSKGGYIPLDGEPPASRDEYRAYVKREFIDTEILRPADIIAGGHSLAPRFIKFCLAKSRQNLGVRCIDVYYLHNPEQQAAAVGRDELRARLRSVFLILEEAATRGEIGAYGCATWNGLRSTPDAADHIELEELVGLARDAGGKDHHFRAVQMPISLAMPEAIRAPTQTVRGNALPAAEAAAALDLMVVGSATLMQGKLTTGLPAAVADAFPALETDAQRSIAFVRSIPGVTAALVGMKRAEHVDENLRAAEPG
jgi:aryl-alcohol dehydrogenase-like predicted oxidoreductase